MKLKNCINCGAPLLGNAVCEYCGTDYRTNAKHEGFKGEFDQRAGIGTVKIYGKEFKAYVNSVIVEQDVPDCRVGISGRWVSEETKPRLLLEVVAYDD